MLMCYLVSITTCGSCTYLPVGGIPGSMNLISLSCVKAKKERAESSDYVNIKVGESRLLRFLPARGIKIVDKTYQTYRYEN